MEDEDEKIEGRGSFIIEDVDEIKDDGIASARFQLGLQSAMMDAASKFNVGLSRAGKKLRSKEQP
ncbi:MAG: hypothetical protein AB7E32_14755 [Desulfovibrio sp.]